MLGNFDDPLKPGEPRANAAAVEHLVRRLVGFRRMSNSGVFAVTGDWGSGKSSLADAATASLSKKHQWHAAKFEPWAYSDYASMLDGFFETLQQQLKHLKLGNDAVGVLVKLLESIAPFGSLGGAVGMPLDDAISGLASVLERRGNYSDRKKAADKIFQALNNPIVIVVDDLDRLDAQELMWCFKLIRLLGRLDNVYYILCYDERTLIDVMSKTDVVGNDAGNTARLYLEKIVQVRVDVPELAGVEQWNMWNDELKKLIEAHGIDGSEVDRSRLKQMWDLYFVRHLNKPRAMKRFVLQLSSSWYSIAGEVNFTDFVAMTFIREYEASLYAVIKVSKPQLVFGHYEVPKNANVTTAFRQAYWVDVLAKHKVDDPDVVLQFLGLLFDGVVEKDFMDLSTWRSRRIDKELYFDRYFRNMLAIEDIPERAYRAYLEDVVQGERCDAAERVHQKVSVTDERVIDRVEEEFTKRGTEPLPIFAQLQSQYAHMFAYGSLKLAGSYPISELAKAVVNRATGMLPLAEKLNWFEAVCAEPGGLALLTDVFDHGYHISREMPDEGNNEFLDGIVALAKRHLSTLFTHKPSTVDHSALRGLRIIMRADGLDAMKDFVRSSIDDSKLWTPEDLMPSFLKVQHQITEEKIIYVTSDVEVYEEDVDEMLGHRWINGRIKNSHATESSFVSWEEELLDYSEMKALASHAYIRAMANREARMGS
jgi:hypothetical protein